jgi:hypothetical protein
VRCTSGAPATLRGDVGHGGWGDGEVEEGLEIAVFAGGEGAEWCARHVGTRGLAREENGVAEPR